MRSLIWALTAGLVVCGWVNRAAAQTLDDAKWIWFDAGNPAVEAPAGKVWFRREVRATEPSTGALRIACDDKFVVWVNGQKIGEGGGLKVFRYNLNGIVERGLNVIAVEATNTSGKAGLFVDGEIRGQGGKSVPFDSDKEWKATQTAPAGAAWLNPRFDDSGWQPVKELGPHASSPWKEIQIAGTFLDRFDLSPGFELQRIAEPQLVGSIIALTWGNRGRLIVSRQGGPILALVDDNRDGTYDRAVEYSAEVKNCQGLCMVFDDLYAVGDGPKGTGVYRLPDQNHDDQADETQLLVNHKGGIGEHGPHDVVFGPDGWLYHNSGNHAWITNSPEATTAGRHAQEGYLLQPKFEDAGGHAVGIKAPGGTIWRFTPDGKKWWLETNGFRNEYDIAFNAQGDLFSFDSDMEWDVGLPWYRPVRINHCIPGAEFGWRSGAAKWPAYYFDSLPGTIDVGRGSPTGVVFYEHTQFPEKYRGTLLNCDWSMGRIIVGHLKPEGATYGGTWDNLITGNPLNVADIEVDRDGSVVFCTGGRGTEGGVYRIRYGSGDKPPALPPADTVADALAMPQLQAGWAREAVAGIKHRVGDRWAAELIATVRTGTPAQKIRALTLLSQFGPQPETALIIAATGDQDSSVRAFATWLLGNNSTPEVASTLAKLLQDKSPVVQRRACEAFVRSGLEAPVTPVLALLGSQDRWLRFAARIALERVPAEKWKKLVLESANIDVALNGLLALSRLDQETLSSQAAVTQLEKLFADSKADARQRADMRRMLELVLVADESGVVTTASAQKAIGRQLIQELSESQRAAKRDAKNGPADLESARLIAFLQIPEGTPLLIQALTHAETAAQQMHYALCLRYIKVGWTFDLKRQLLDWYETTRDLEGGNSLQGYLRNIVGGTLDSFTPEDRQQLLQTWAERPFATRLLLTQSQPEQVRDYDKVIGGLLADIEKQPGHAQLSELVSLTIDALGKSTSPAAQQTLRNLFDEHPDRREQLARSLAARPTVENWPYLVRSLQFGDSTTLQLCMQALKGIDQKPEQPEQIRSVILAGLKLGQNGGLVATALLQRWTGSPHKAGKDVPAALAHYQAWFREKYPQSPPAELSPVDLDKTKYSYQQLVDFLEQDPRGQQGSAERGKAIFAKANCIKCHRFVKDGEGVGPDLTTVRRRFQRKEIVESLVLPSQVISDQYRMVTIETVDGLVYTGMPLPQQGKANTVLLLLSDATKLEVPKKKIEEMTTSKTSVMPEGLLKDLSLEEIADLFAFLETSKSNPEPIPAKSP
jgi:putative membrane-bound dehydrogenase-like protein